MSLIGASLVVWLLAANSPFIIPNTINLTSPFLVYALGIFLLIYSGMLLAMSFPPRIGREVQVAVLRQLMFALLLVGVAFRALDRLVLRPVTDLFSSASIREARLDGSNIASIIGTLAPALGVVLLASLASKKRLTRGQLVAARVIASIYLLDLFLSGSRGISLIVFLLVFGITFSIRTLVVVAPIVILVFGAVFLSRFLDLIGQTDQTQIAFNSSIYGYAYYVPASPLSQEILHSSLGLQLFFPALQILQYAAHGVFEFADVFTRVSEFHWAPAQLIPQVPGLAAQDTIEFRQNLYYTLPGTLALSFGLIGALLVAFPVGYWIGRVAVTALHYSGGIKLVMAIVIFGIPFVNTVGGFDLVFFLIGLSLLGMIRFQGDNPALTPSTSSLSRSAQPYQPPQLASSDAAIGIEQGSAKLSD